MGGLIDFSGLTKDIQTKLSTPKPRKLAETERTIADAARR